MKKIFSIFNAISIAATFVLLSFIIVAAQSADFGYDKPYVFFTFIIFAACCVFLFFLLSFAEQKLCKTQTKTEHLLVLLALALFIVCVFFPIQFGELDGELKDYQSAPALFNDLWRWGLALLISFVFLKFFGRTAKYLGAVLTTISVASFLFLPIQQREGQIGEKIDNLHIFSSDKNIIYIVFDGGLGFAFDYLVRTNPEFAQGFKDFSVYPHCITPSLRTRLAMPLLISGAQPYEIDSKQKEKEAVTETSFLKKAEKVGYTLYPFQDHPFISSWAVEKTYSVPAFVVSPEQFTKASLKIIYNCSLRLLPKAITQRTKELLRPKNMSKELFKWVDDPTLTKIVSKLFLEKLATESKVANSEPVLFAYHSLLTHGPFLYLPNGEFTDARNGNFLHETEFALYEMSNFLQRLKEIGAYENSLIIIISDHGTANINEHVEDWTKYYAEVNEFIDILPDYYVNSNSQATEEASFYNSVVMIKYPYSSNDKATSYAHPVSSLKTYPLISAFLQAPDWKDPSLNDLFEKLEMPIWTRVLHKEDFKKAGNKYTKLEYWQNFELPEGLKSLREILDTLEPVAE